MSLSAGVRLGPYEIVAPLGKGGMGEVYRARDTRLGRDVAIKVLPASVAADAERVRRFEREARLLASLSHPHIGAIHGLEEAAGVPALVLELVEGPTLADRVAARPLPLQEALNVARQIAEALEAAHEKGIIHRDLKPSNIKMMADGTVKVLDFGIAKALMGDRAGADVALLPTVTLDGTLEGKISGTPAYMSPEQARGESVDKRCDIWAFGVVLYEMLTGKRLFVGASTSDVLAGVLKTEPDWNALPAATPPAIRTLLRRCLTRDVRRRLQAMGEARIALEDDLADPGGMGDADLSGRSTRERVAWTVAATALVLTVASVFTAVYVRQRQQTPIAAPPVQVEITTPPTHDPFSFAISPDGRRLAFAGRSGEVEQRLWIRSLDAPVAQPLPGTEGAHHPFWSPDSHSIGFFAEGKLKRIDLGGAAPLVLSGNSACGCAFGGTWNVNGVIVFGGLESPLYRVSASGGEPVAITKVERPSESHLWPFFLPDGRHVLYMSGIAGRVTDVYVHTLGSTESRLLLHADSATAYGFGYLFYLREGALVAHPFDAASQTLTGAPMLVANQVGFQMNRSEAAYSVSAAGAIAYRPSRIQRRQLVWVDRSGKELGTLGEYEGSAVGTLEFEPHGNRAAFSWTWTEGNTDIYLVEPDKGPARRFTLDPKADFDPVWSPDGKRIVFSSDRNGSYDLYQKLSTGAGPEEALLTSPVAKLPSDWSPDGQFLLYWQTDPKTKLDLWVLPMIGDRKPRPFVVAESDQLRGRFAPNGKWVAYQSYESGRSEIYVQAFPGPGSQWLVSTNGGHSPRWARSGSELYYIAADGKLMAVSVRPNADTFVAGTPTALFQTRLEFGRFNGGCSYCTMEYDVAADGRFLMTVLAEEASTLPINLILNWPAALKK
jgi:serine/threonine protein kinase